MEGHSKVRNDRFWRVVKGETPKWRCWGGDYVVFNPLSGHTHFLDIVTGRILILLMAGSCPASVVRSSVSSFLEVADDDRLAATVHDILMRLEDAGLIESLD
jgi:PqqD family protein of HPr-rel-A system